VSFGFSILIPYFQRFSVHVVTYLNLNFFCDIRFQSAFLEETSVRKLKIAIIDLVTKGPTRSLYARVMHPNLASIMPQVIAVWCKQAGHDVKFVCYTGFENLFEELPADMGLRTSSRSYRPTSILSLLAPLPRPRSYPTPSAICSDSIAR
jgi:hypothetical protein